MEQAGWPGHERTKDLVTDQSPDSAGHPGSLTTTPLRRRPCASHKKSCRLSDPVSDRFRMRRPSMPPYTNFPTPGGESC